MLQAKAWTTIDSLSIILKSDLYDKIKRDFIQTVAGSVLLHGFTIKLGGDWTRILCAVVNKFWKQHFSKQQLYGHLPTISQAIQVKQIRHAGLVSVFNGIPSFVGYLMPKPFS